ncbi:hypothetical protein PFISCL1PPCAC_19793, partial [Pristionchus fissidentatus]
WTMMLAQRKRFESASEIVETRREKTGRGLATNYIRLIVEGKGEERQRIANDLHKYLTGRFREESLDFQHEFINYFDSNGDNYGANTLYELMHSKDERNDKESSREAAILLIVVVADTMMIMEGGGRVLKLAHYLLNVLLKMDESGMELCTRALAFLIQTSKVCAAELVEKCLDQSFEWTQEEMNCHSESRRLACCILLRELALSTSTAFFLRVPSFFSSIFDVMRSPRVNVRTAAASSLHAALSVTTQREARDKSKWYYHCYQEAIGALVEKKDGMGKEERNHCMLLTLNELLRIADASIERERILAIQSTKSTRKDTVVGSPLEFLYAERVMSTVESRTAARLIEDNIATIFERIMEARTCKQSYVLSTLVEILPRLSLWITSSQSITCIESLLPHIKYPKAQLSLGLFVLINGQAAKKYVFKILSFIKDSLQTAKKRKHELPSDSFILLTLIVRSYGNEVNAEMRELLALLLNHPLCRGLTTVLHEIYRQLDHSRINVTNGLLHQLSMILIGESIVGKEVNSLRSLPSMKHDLSADSIDRSCLAMKSLGEFEFDRSSLHVFIQYIAEGYLVCDSPLLRLSAVKCCVAMLRPFIHEHDTVSRDERLQILTLVQCILKCLVNVSVVDSDVTVRLCVINELSNGDSSLLSHLSQPEILEFLRLSLRDEKLDVQEASVSLLSQIAMLNPSLVLPRLRRVLLETIGQFTNSRDEKVEQHSARLIFQMASQCPKFMRPYLKSVLEALISKLHDSDRNAHVTVDILNCISELAIVGGSEIVDSVGVIFPHLISFITHNSSMARREAALHTMCHLVASTASVVDVYREYPKLLNSLLSLMKTEMSQSMRRLSMRVLGTLGAIDPYTFKVFSGLVYTEITGCNTGLSLPTSNEVVDSRQEIYELFNYGKCTLTEFYSSITIANLMIMLESDAYQNNYGEIIEDLISILRSLGTESPSFVCKVIPQLITITSTTKKEKKEFFLTQLASLLSMMDSHSTQYLNQVFVLIARVWKENWMYEATIFRVIHTIASTLHSHMGPYISEVIPYVVKGLKIEREKDQLIVSQSLACLSSLCGFLSSYLHLIIPPLLSIILNSSIEMGLRRDGIETLHSICEMDDLSDYSPRIIQLWIKVVCLKDLQTSSMSLLRLMIVNKWKHLNVFQRSIESTLQSNNIHCHEYSQYLRENGQIMGWREESWRSREEIDGEKEKDSLQASNLSIRSRARPKSPLVLPTSMAKYKINFDSINRSMRISNISSAEDWSDWIVKVRQTFIRNSSSSSIRSVSSLCDAHQQLAKDLFNAAFLSVWMEVNEEMQDEITNIFIRALESCHRDVVHSILNLCEFMDHSNKGPLVISYEQLGKSAAGIRCYAKALRYKEMEVKMGKGDISLNIAHDIITFSNKLNLQEEAVGVIKCVERQKGSIEISKMMRSRWYERLNEWERSLELLYECRMDRKKGGGEENLQEMDEQELKCLEALGNWNQLNNKMKSCESNVDGMRVIGARGCWMSDKWAQMEDYTERVNENTLDGSYLRAVVALRHEDYKKAHEYIEKCRDLHDVQLTEMANESYDRVYPAIVLLQELTELEEAIEYRLRPERRGRIALLWSRRLHGCRENVNQWHKLLMIRSLVLSPSEMHPLRVKFSSLCRSQNKMSMSRSQLAQLIGIKSDSPLHSSTLSNDKPHLTLALCKQLWADEHKSMAMSRLESLARHLDRWPLSAHSQETKGLTAKTFLKLGEWSELLHSHMGPSMEGRSTVITNESGIASARIFAREAVQSGTANIQLKKEEETETAKMIYYYSKTTEYDREWHKGWHRLATAYFNALSREKESTKKDAEKEKRKNNYAIEAVKAFTKALQMASGSRLEDTLRLIALCFDYGEDERVYNVLSDSHKSLPLVMWLEVIPQLMARLDSTSKAGVLLHQIVLEVAKKYPQSMVYSLTVGSKSSNSTRAKHSCDILNLLSNLHPALVAQTEMVSNELVRCAILWNELWYDALEEASRLYFVEKDVEGMLKILEPMHRLLDGGPNTLKEHSFYQTYLCDLEDARKFCLAFQRTGNGKELTQAWELYYSIFKRIAAQLKTMTSLDLNYISPILQKAKELELAVPGSFHPSSPPVTIYSFGSHLQVIASKQRPRKMSMRGSDGFDYSFLLKGHEDPRQDQRVIQFFGLINTLLLHNGDTCKRNLTIERYSITALSQKSGLIGWLPECDTLHSLVKEYREKKKVDILMEHKVMTSSAPDLDQLTIMQKMQLFQMALDTSEGEDLADIMWLKSPSSEVWFERRTNYTRSMACMSMVGHILGLGDRHPSNVMIDRVTGKIVHIDFGDCFEVAQTREKYPEKIPFRLTRTLVKAMEITGIEGNYRLTCERVLQVLRGKKDSLVAVLEAFVYDPLINWRLLDVNKRNPGEKKDTSKEDSSDVNEEVSRKVLDRIKLKLTGREFDHNQMSSIQEQIDRLVNQATSQSNLAQSYIGWCPFW